MLDAKMLSVADVDLDFYLTLATGATGTILSGSGGHADSAAGAKLGIAATEVVAGGGAKFVDRVGCIKTPGQTLDAVLTELDVVVNPPRSSRAWRYGTERDLRARNIGIRWGAYCIRWRPANAAHRGRPPDGPWLARSTRCVHRSPARGPSGTRRHSDDSAPAMRESIPPASCR